VPARPGIFVSVRLLLTFTSGRQVASWDVLRTGNQIDQGYADVIAFILASNGFPDGERELPANVRALENIVIEGKR
jgi:hypothetical protein